MATELNCAPSSRRLAIESAHECLPYDVPTIPGYFSRRGAYGRFQTFLDAKGKLQQWHDYERAQKGARLRKWCEESEVEIELAPN